MSERIIKVKPPLCEENDPCPFYDSHYMSCAVNCRLDTPTDCFTSVCPIVGQNIVVKLEEVVKILPNDYYECCQCDGWFHRSKLEVYQGEDTCIYCIEKCNEEW